MREPPPRSAAFTLATAPASVKRRALKVETKVPPRKWMAVAPEARLEKVMELRASEAPAAWVAMESP